MEYQHETLVAELRKSGIHYLAPSNAVASESITSGEELIVALLEHADPRLQMSLVPLFIRNPHLATHLPALVNSLSAAAALELKLYYMAAAYLQRLWEIRLGFYIDNRPLLPDLYSQELGLPPYAFNRLASLTKTMDLFFEQLKLENPLPRYAPMSRSTR